MSYIVGFSADLVLKSNAEIDILSNSPKTEITRIF